MGVAVCKTGLPMTSFEGTKGNVEDLGKEGFFSSEGEVPPQGRVLVFDNKGMVCDVGGGGRVGGNGDAGVVDVVTEVELAVEVFVVDTVEVAVEVETTLAPPLGGSCNLSSFFVEDLSD